MAERVGEAERRRRGGKEAAVRAEGRPAGVTVGGAKLAGPGSFSECVRVRREDPLAERVGDGALGDGDGALGERMSLCRRQAERAEMSGKDEGKTGRE